ncbi:MAG: hypothetical protein HY652_13595 [Acidobacteria bacterium]|nr:hypothetical protein [Acidobacteriota bacterium]
MAKKKSPARLSIYLHDPAVRRQAKITAAKQDLSVSEYCLRAIIAQLTEDGERPVAEGRATPLEAAVETARRFQAETFRGRVFSVSSAYLIREARKSRGLR